jgi:hypothetical protein
MGPHGLLWTELYFLLLFNININITAAGVDEESKSSTKALKRRYTKNVRNNGMLSSRWIGKNCLRLQGITTRKTTYDRKNLNCDVVMKI